MEKRKRKKRQNEKATDPTSQIPNESKELTVVKTYDGEPSSFTHTEIYPVEIMQAKIQAGDLYEEQLTRQSKIPEKGLLAAMIERAILDLKQPDALVRKQAEKWIFEQPTDRIFGIYWCLDWLNMIGGIDRLRVECRTLINNKAAQLIDAKAVAGAFLGNHRGNRAVEMMFRL